MICKDFKIMNRLLVKPLNKNGIVTSGNFTVFFLRAIELDNVIATLDNPDQGHHILINEFDILEAYDLLTNELVYKYNMERGL